MAETPLTEIELLRWAESLAGIAQTGLAFTESLYEQERFEEILHVAAEIKAHSARGFDENVQVAEWMNSVGDRTAGYVTPKTAIGAVVGNDQGEILPTHGDRWASCWLHSHPALLAGLLLPSYRWRTEAPSA